MFQQGEIVRRTGDVNKTMSTTERARQRWKREQAWIVGRLGRECFPKEVTYDPRFESQQKASHMKSWGRRVFQGHHRYKDFGSNTAGLRSREKATVSGQNEQGWSEAKMKLERPKKVRSCLACWVIPITGSRPFPAKPCLHETLFSSHRLWHRLSASGRPQLYSWLTHLAIAHKSDFQMPMQSFKVWMELTFS